MIANLLSGTRYGAPKKTTPKPEPSFAVSSANDLISSMLSGFGAPKAEVAEPVATPVAEPVAKPVAKPATKLVSEPIVEKVAEPVAEPVS